MNELNLATSNAILAAALNYSGKQGYRPMSIVVLDAGGHPVAMQRQDGATLFRAEIASGKAWAAVSMGVSSRNLGERAAGNPTFFNALASTGHGKFIPQVGAVLIKNAEGRVLGSVGASGGTGDEDEAICIHGIQAAGLVAG